VLLFLLFQFTIELGVHTFYLSVEHVILIFWSLFKGGTRKNLLNVLHIIVPFYSPCRRRVLEMFFSSHTHTQESLVENMFIAHESSAGETEDHIF
jgi:hypothetical protein